MLPFYKKPVFLLPDGPKNLAALFPGIDFSKVDEYFLTLKTTADDILVTTPVNKTGCYSEDVVRIHFENFLGQWDAVNFDQVTIETEVTSSAYKKILPVPFRKTDTGEERFNVRSGKTYTASTTCYPEEAMPWLMELASCTKALMEWKGIEDQSDEFLPVVILDGKYIEKKIEDRFVYLFSIQFRLSNEHVHIRG
jgi:hypothetical protein